MSSYTFTSNNALDLALHEWGESYTAANATYGWISTWDVSLVTDMEHAFQGICLVDANFDEDLSDWDVGAVTNMLGTFDECVRFNSDLSRWDVSQVTNMEQMFQFTRFFNQDISGWDVRNEATNFREMFPSDLNMADEYKCRISLEWDAFEWWREESCASPPPEPPALPAPPSPPMPYAPGEGGDSELPLGLVVGCAAGGVVLLLGVALACRMMRKAGIQDDHEAPKFSTSQARMPTASHTTRASPSATSTTGDVEMSKYGA
tara:strand:+ start:1449 stop:2234 length:786 start_codon:yes stop_codon:yes gene_type:complete